MQATAVAPARAVRAATIEDWLAIPAEKRAELIDGRIVYQGMPGPDHGSAQLGTGAAIFERYHRRRGSPDKPGGWWISAEVEMEIGGLGCRPDLVGWRRDKHARMPKLDERGVCTAVPDWICEVLSPGSARIDLGAKRVAYHRAGVEHYWIANPANETLTVFQWTQLGYLVVLATGYSEKVRAAPFDAVELDVARLLGGDEYEPPGDEPR